MARGRWFYNRKSYSSEEESEGEEERKESSSEEVENGQTDESLIDESAAAEEPSGAIFQPYDPPKLKEGRDHPDPVVETAILAEVDPPDITYKHHLKKQMLDGTLSRLQLESIVYAMQKFDGPRLISEERHGYFLGDGAGVGKGRQIAGLIAENWHRGATRALWVSVNMDLKLDAQRDLTDLKVELDLWPKGRSFPSGDCFTYGDGVMFCTYSFLTREKRISQITEWLRADPSGSPLIIFDESHRAKHFNSTEGKALSKTAVNVVRLQAEIPDALILYCSATGASEPRNLGYMTRLGAWGFESYSQFVKTLGKGGMGAMEMFAMALKAVGSYSCRSLSYAGAEFEVCSLKIPEDFVTQYETAASFWQLLLRIQKVWSTYFERRKNRLDGIWSSHLRFFKQMLMASKVPSLAIMAQEAVDNGMCVVIGLQATGEAFLNDVKEDDGDDVDDMMSAPRLVLQKVVTNIIAPSLLSMKRTCIPCEAEVIQMVRKWVQKNPPPRVRCRSVPIRRQVPSAVGRSSEREDTDVEMLTVMNSEEVEAVKLKKAKASGSYVVLDDNSPNEDDRMKLHTSWLIQSQGTRKRGNSEAPICLSDDEDEDIQIVGTKGVKIKGKNQIKTPVVDLEEEEADKEEEKEEEENEGDDDSDCELLDGGLSLWGGSDKITPKEEKADTVSKPSVNCTDWKAFKLTSNGRKRVKFETPGKVTSDYPTVDLKKSPLKASTAQNKTVRKPRELFKDETNPSTSSKSGVSTPAGTRGKRGRESGLSTKEKKATAAEEARDKSYDSPEKLRQVDRICNSLLKAIGNLDLPFNPLDDLKALLGGEEHVAEMTGRREEMVTDDNGSITCRRRCGGVATKEINIQEQKNFMNGKKHIAIISEAASCGISLQADRRVPNQRRRLHITLELPWSAEKAVQQFGRSHRSNQVSAPIYRILMTNCGGEKRFASSAAKRLESLGALLRGDRRAVGAGPELKEFNVDNMYGTKALRQMVLDIMSYKCSFDVNLPTCPNNEDFQTYAKKLIIAAGLAYEDTSTERIELLKVTQFLNRILGLSFSDQELLFNHFSQYYDHIVKKFRAMGHYDEGILSLKGQSIRMLPGYPQVIHKDPIYLKEAKLAKLELDRGISWEGIKQKSDEDQKDNFATFDSKNGFWVSSYCGDEIPGIPPKVLLATAIGGDTSYNPIFRKYRIQTPNLNGYKTWTLEKVEEMWKKTTIEKAEKSWRYWYERTERKCEHGPSCKTSTCRVGTRMQNHDLIIGHPLSIFKDLWEIRKGKQSERILRVVRAELDDGSKLLGIQVKLREIQPLLDRLGLPENFVAF